MCRCGLLTWHVLALRGRRCGVDRCALFVDAGYVLADGAMAVHGTRRRESVSWDYAGLLQLLGSLAMERTRLPLLRCYWYEATVEGRRIGRSRHPRRPARRQAPGGQDAAGPPGGRRGRDPPGPHHAGAEQGRQRRDGGQRRGGPRAGDRRRPGHGHAGHAAAHRRRRQLATIPRALRQECDDIVEISAAHLRPYVELISGAEPPRPDEPRGAMLALRAGHQRQRSTGNGAQRQRPRERPGAARRGSRQHAAEPARSAATGRTPSGEPRRAAGTTRSPTPAAGGRPAGSTDFRRRARTSAPASDYSAPSTTARRGLPVPTTRPPPTTAGRSSRPGPSRPRARTARPARVAGLPRRDELYAAPVAVPPPPTT